MNYQHAAVISMTVGNYAHSVITMSGVENGDEDDLHAQMTSSRKAEKIIWDPQGPTPDLDNIKVLIDRETRDIIRWIGWSQTFADLLKINPQDAPAK